MQSKQDDIKIKSQEDNEKIRNIGMVLGLLEETRRGKDWIFKEMKKHGLKMPIKSTMNGYEILSSCPPNFIDTLLRTLRGDDIVPPQGVTTQTYHWFFSDIVAGSNPTIPTNAQVQKIVVLNELIAQTQTFKKRNIASTIILPTGDGMAIGFGDSPEKPLLLSIELHKALSKYNESKRGKEKLLLRIGIDSGLVYFVKDLEGKDNVWGPGIIMTRRVMDLCGDMQIFAASRLAEELVKVSQTYKEFLHFAKNYETKYGEKIQLYNVYGKGFGNKKAQTKSKKTAKDMQRNIKVASNFSFNEIKILLDVIDVKTMQTRHTWIWDLVNISKEAKHRIFYYLDGQTPHDFSDLNVKVTDQNNNRLEISEIGASKPYRKEFYATLERPILPRQKIVLKLEYKWERPERTFLYEFPSGAKKFSYTCTLPKEINLKNRILKVDLATGYKVHATPPVTIKQSNDKTLMTWSKKNIVLHDAYQFEW